MSLALVQPVWLPPRTTFGAPNTMKSPPLAASRAVSSLTGNSAMPTPSARNARRISGVSSSCDNMRMPQSRTALARRVIDAGTSCARATTRSTSASNSRSARSRRPLASAEQASAFGCSLSRLLTDFTQPALECRGITRSFCSKNGRNLAQRVDRLDLDLSRLAVAKLCLQPVVSRGPAVAGLEVGDHGLYQRVGIWVGCGPCERGAAGERFLQKAEQSARFGGRNGHSRIHRASQEERPFILGEIGLVGHGLFSLMTATDAANHVASP